MFITQKQNNFFEKKIIVMSELRIINDDTSPIDNLQSATQVNLLRLIGCNQMRAPAKVYLLEAKNIVFEQCTNAWIDFLENFKGEVYLYGNNKYTKFTSNAEIHFPLLHIENENTVDLSNIETLIHFNKLYVGTPTLFQANPGSIHVNEMICTVIYSNLEIYKRIEKLVMKLQYVDKVRRYCIENADCVETIEISRTDEANREAIFFEMKTNNDRHAIKVDMQSNYVYMACYTNNYVCNNNNNNNVFYVDDDMMLSAEIQPFDKNNFGENTIGTTKLKRLMSMSK